MRRHLRLLLPLIGLILFSLVRPDGAEGVAYSRVYINGVLRPVSFNDGDSFRIRAGADEGTQCRLGGYNTLESYGPVHQWAEWHPYELYINAKRATLNARRGQWHCTSDGEQDTYGRLLMDCPDLAVDQIRRGYAHAMQIDDTPSRPEYLRAQQEAIAARRGMWAHGVPDYVMTSLHSATEDPNRPIHYNRLVSVRDGHSESMQHNEVYSECQWVCNQELRIDIAPIEAAAQRLRQDTELAPLLAEHSNLHLIEFVSRFRRLGVLPEYLNPEAVSGVQARLSAELAQGLLGQTHTATGACALYVAFEGHRRFGGDRAVCLRDHGVMPPGSSRGPNAPEFH